MALDLGTISGVIGLDSGPFNKTLTDTEGRLKKWSADQATEAQKGGEEGGKRFADGWGKKALVLMGGAGLAVAGAFATALAQGMNLQPANQKVAASLGLTKDQAGVAAKAAGQLYSANWGESMEDAAARTGVVISSISGMRTATAEEVAKMTGLFSAFSDGFEVDMSRSTQVVGQMVKSGLVKDTEEGLDLLTAALQKVPANVREDVMDAVDEYGPFMQSLGISGEQAMNMLAKSAEKGMYGIDKTGDALKEFTIRATDMSTASKAGYDILGMSQEKMSEALLKGGAEGEAAFNQIITGLRDIKDPVEQSQAALALFGTPLEDLSVSEIPAFLDGLNKTKNVLGETDGAVQSMSDTMSDSASGNLSSFYRTVQSGAVEFIGGMLIPKLTEVTTNLNRELGPGLSEAGRNLEGFGRWVKDNESWLGPLSVAVGVFGGALAALGLVGYISSLGGLSAAFVALAGKIGITTAATAAKHAIELVATGASKAMAAAQWLVNAALSANPIGLVVLAIAGLVAAFVLAYQNSEEFRNVVDGALQGVKDTAKAVGDWFTGPFVGFFKNAGAWIGDQFDGIGEWFVRTGDDLKATGRRVGDFFTIDIPGFFGTAAQKIGGAFGAVKDKLIAPIRDAAAWINNNFVSGINGFLGNINVGWRLPNIPGFAEGGYTGGGGKYAVKGVVHGGEVVWSQEDVAAHGGPAAVDAMRREREFYGGGIVPNAKGWAGFDPTFLAGLKGWAAATGQTWSVTGNGGFRARADQQRAYDLYKAGAGPLAAAPGTSAHERGLAADLSPRPGENPRARALLASFGLGLTVPGEAWHVGRAGGGGGGGGTFDFGIGSLINGLVGKLPFGAPWGDVIKAMVTKVPDGIMKGIMGFFGAEGYSMGTQYANPGLASVAENGAELVLGKSVRNFGGGETVFNNAETSQILGGRSGVSIGQVIIKVMAEDLRSAADVIELFRSLPLQSLLTETVG